MWKEEIKEVVIFTVDNSWNKEQFANLIEEKIISDSFKFYFMIESKNFPERKKELDDILCNKRLDYEFFEFYEVQKNEMFDSIDFGIHVGGDFDILKSNANWKILATSGEQHRYGSSQRSMYENLGNCYLVYDLNDVKDVLVFFAANGLEC